MSCAEQRVRWFAHHPVFCCTIPFSLWFLHSSCGPRWVEMSWAGSKQQSGALILHVHNTLLKDFLSLGLAWSCSLAGRSRWVLNALGAPSLPRPGGPTSCQWGLSESRGVKGSTFPSWDFNMPLQLSAFSISSCWEVCVGTFFWIIGCWVFIVF